MISSEEFRLVRQHIIKIGIRLTITDEKGSLTDENMKLYGEIEGIVNGGSISLDAGSAVRRTASFTIIPTKQTVNINEKSLIWLNKNVIVTLWIYDQRTGEIGHTWTMGNFLYNSASSSYDASNNIMTIELSDWMMKLDGTINGQVGGVLTTTIPAYHEDPDTGEPLEYSTIKNAVEAALRSAGLTSYIQGQPSLNTYVVDDIGEYYAFPIQGHPEWNWQQYRNEHPLWNTVPYDLDFSSGCTVWDIISELINLYPNYDGAYDENGVFRVHLIPSEYEDSYDFMYEDYRDMVISEQIQTDLTNVRNICEVWGETLDADWYAENVRHADNVSFEYQIWFYTDDDGTHRIVLRKLIEPLLGKWVTYEDEEIFGQYTTMDKDWYDLNISFSNGTLYIYSRYNNLQWDSSTYPSGALIYSCTFANWGQMPSSRVFIDLFKTNISNSDYIVPLEGYPKDYRTSTRFGVKFFEDDNSVSGQLMRINDLEALPIIDFSTLQPIGADFFDLDQIHVFQIMNIKTSEDNYIKQVYYVGVAQSHAINVLSNGQTVYRGYRDPDTGRYYDLYSKEYYQHVLNCKNVSITVIEDSPFVVQKLGNRISVKTDGEFSNITSDELALERAEYENWKNSRLTDNVTITTKLMPFVTPYMKIDYKRSGANIRNDYIVQSVSHDFDQGTTTITMYTFYPLYKRQPGLNDQMTYNYMAGYLNDNLYGDEDLT